MRRAVDFVAIGTSLGGMTALETLFSRLPEDFSPPLGVVQHRSSDSTAVLAGLLSRRTTRPVVEPDHGTAIEAGTVYLAPAAYHLLVEADGTSLSLSTEGPVSWARPSIDVLFESAAEAFGPRVAGVLLTGSSDDGARGSRAIADNGGFVFVQTPEEAESPIAPRAALALVPRAHRGTLHEIADQIARLDGPAGVAQAARRTP